jgi:hypothetical protein
MPTWADRRIDSAPPPIGGEIASFRSGLGAQ